MAQSIIACCMLAVLLATPRTLAAQAGLRSSGVLQPQAFKARAATVVIFPPRAKVPLTLEEGQMPPNTYSNKAPFKATVSSVEHIVGPNATVETCNIVIQTDGKIPFWEGQSFGVIPPGTRVNSRGIEVPHRARLYSIASSRYGDSFDGNTATLCVRRATYFDPETGKDNPDKKGICSNFLCDARPGQEIMMTGPTGKELLMPKDPSSVLICVATGEGIAPFRSFWRRSFFEYVPSYNFSGLFWVFMGVAKSDDMLYNDEIQAISKAYPSNFRLVYALSHEQTNKRGGRMSIQDKIMEYSDEVIVLLEQGAHMYFSGRRVMMPGILDTLRSAATTRGLDFEEFVEDLKNNNQWHLNVY